MKRSFEPKISVIMSVHNGMPFLRKAVESVLKQNYRNFEFIIVDDYSSDDSWKYLETIKDKRLCLIKNSKNFGLAKSLNKALKKSTGCYIARMDADDICALNRFSTQLQFMENNPEVDLCGSFAKLINEKGKVLSLVKKPINDAQIKKLNKWMPSLIHPTWFVKRDVFEKLKGYDENFDMVEDYDFLLRAKDFKMANVPKPLLYWRSVRKRRSLESINEMYKKSFYLRIKYFFRGDLGILFLPYLVRSAIVTYFLPASFKVLLNKKAGLL